MKYNSGIKNGQALQNQFTAYLHLAVVRKRNSFLQKKQKREEREILFQDEPLELLVQDEFDFLSNLPLADQMESEALSKAIGRLPQTERYILQLRGIEGLPYQEVAQRLHKNVWTVKATYLRMIHKFRKIL